MGRSYKRPCLTPTDKNVQNYVCEKYRKTSLGSFFKLEVLSTSCYLLHHGGQTGKFHPLVAYAVVRRAEVRIAKDITCASHNNTPLMY